MSLDSRVQLERALYENLAILANEEASTDKLSSTEMLREMVRLTGELVANGGVGGGGGAPAIAGDVPVFVNDNPPAGYSGKYVRFVPNGDGTVTTEVEDGGIS